MIYGLREYIVNQMIVRLNQMLVNFTPTVQVVGQYSQVKLTYPNVYVKASLPSFSSSVLGDFWSEGKDDDGNWQEEYAVRIPNLAVILNVAAKNEIERAKITDKVIATLLMGKTQDGIEGVVSGLWWKDVLYGDGLQLKAVSLAAEAEENTPQEGKLFRSQVMLAMDTEFKAQISDDLVSLITATGIVVSLTI